MNYIFHDIMNKSNKKLKHPKGENTFQPTVLTLKVFWFSVVQS